jgi:sigma-E factor negative regulatory protein RseB
MIQAAERTMPRPRHAFAWLLLGWSLSAQGDEAFQWLERMGQAVRDLSYEGVFVYRHGNQMEAMRLVHGNTGGREMERLVALNGPPREVIRDEHSVLCVLPEQRAVSVGWRGADQRYRALLSRSPEELAAYYDFKLEDKERVAGRPVQVIRIDPRDPYRYGQRLYLDEQHALPLRSDLLDANGEAVSQIMFTQLRVVPELHFDWGVEAEADGTQYAWTYQPPAQPSEDGGAQGPWRFETLPDGFRMTLHARRNGDDSHPPQEHFVFSDGLATLSVYIETLDPDAPLTEGSRVGPVSIFGRVLHGYQVTVVGEVPEETTRRVASVVQYQPGGHTQ